VNTTSAGSWSSDLTSDVVVQLGKGIGTFIRRKGAQRVAVGPRRPAVE